MPRGDARAKYSAVHELHTYPVSQMFSIRYRYRYWKE